MYAILWIITIIYSINIYSLSPLSFFEQSQHSEEERIDVRLIQLNARVEGQRPQDITDEQIQEWKSMGFNTLYMMGIWKESKYSEVYNKYWGEKTNQDVAGYDNTYRLASAFSIPGYEVNPQLGGERAILELRDRLAKAGLQLMLDFVPNHMAMDNDYIFEHPEYFMHEVVTDQISQEYLNSKFITFEPESWPHYDNQQARYKIWHTADFDYNVRSDHFFLEELDENGVRIRLLKFYHGNKGWRDTVQIDLSNPKARQWMLENVTRVARLCSGIRWDFVHSTLQKSFLRQWKTEFRDPNQEEWYHFLRQWSGVAHLPQRNKAEWQIILDAFIKYKQPELIQAKLSLQGNYEQYLRHLLDLWESYLNDQKHESYASFAVAFHFEGLKELFYNAFFPKMDKDSYERLLKRFSELYFLQFCEELIIKVKKIFPNMINMAEAYEEEGYLLKLGFDAVYASHFFNDLVRDRDGASLETTLERFFARIKDGASIDWPWQAQVLYLQNFDDGPAINIFSKKMQAAIEAVDEIKIKAVLLYGLPGIKYFEWGLLEGNQTRLSASWVQTRIDSGIQPQLQEFFRKFIPAVQLKVMTYGSIQYFEYNKHLKGYKRILGDQEVLVLANITHKEQRINLRDVPHMQELENMLFATNSKIEIKEGVLILPPLSAVWLGNQSVNKEMDAVTFELSRVVLQAA